MKSTKEQVNIYQVKAVKESAINYSLKTIMGAKDAAEIFQQTKMDRATDEYFYIMCLDNKGYPVGIHEVSHGTLNMSPVHPREVFKRALANNAASLILCHNHPSGSLDPSDADKELTKRLKKAANIIGINILDHIIIDGFGGYMSFAGAGMMK